MSDEEVITLGDGDFVPLGRLVRLRPPAPGETASIDEFGVLHYQKEQSPQGLGSVFEEDKIVLSKIPYGERWGTMGIAQLVGYSYTDIVFVLNRLRAAGLVEMVEWHVWKKVE